MHGHGHCPLAGLDAANAQEPETWGKELFVLELVHHGQPGGRVPVLLAEDLAFDLAQIRLGQIGRGRFGQAPRSENLRIGAVEHATRRGMAKEPAASILQCRFRQTE
jgi:hypothetical protein